MLEARVRISRGAGGGYLADLWNSGFPKPGEAPVFQGVFPESLFDEATRDDLLSIIREQTTQGPEFVEAGEKLFQALKVSGIEAPWRVLREQGYRTYLELDDSIAELPWELTGTDVGGIVERLFPDPKSPIVRVHAAGRVKPIPLEPTIRVLLICGEPRASEDQFPAAEMWGILREFLACKGSVHVEILREVPSKIDDIANAIKLVQPHVVHFLGHGIISKATGRPALYFDASQPWSWDSNAIYQHFSTRARVPRMVILNACHSGNQSGLGMAPLATAFCRSGVAAVLAMQATVRIERAQDLARSFYHQLAEGSTLDVALAETRNAVGSADFGTGWDRRDWAIPTLSVSLPVEDLFHYYPVPAEVANCPIFAQFQSKQGPFPFVGRMDERRDLWASLSPFDPQEVPATCLIVEGPAETGKSWLVQRSARYIALQGIVVRHIDFTADRAYDTVSALERVLKGGARGAEAPIQAPLPEAPFSAFRNRALEYRGGQKDLESLRRVVDAFRKGLTEVAGESRIVLILDHLRGRGGIPETEFQIGLLNYLVRPIASDPQSPILLVLVIRPEDASELGLNQVTQAHRIPISLFTPEQFPTLFYEFCRFQSNDRLKVIGNYYQLKYDLSSPWRPSIFSSMRDDVQKFLP